jgi:hypothetical protein
VYDKAYTPIAHCNVTCDLKFLSLCNSIVAGTTFANALFASMHYLGEAMMMWSASSFKDNHVGVDDLCGGVSGGLHHLDMLLFYRFCGTTKPLAEQFDDYVEDGGQKSFRASQLSNHVKELMIELEPFLNSFNSAVRAYANVPNLRKQSKATLKTEVAAKMNAGTVTSATAAKDLIVRQDALHATVRAITSVCTLYTRDPEPAIVEINNFITYASKSEAERKATPKPNLQYILELLEANAVGTWA